MVIIALNHSTYDFTVLSTQVYAHCKVHDIVPSSLSIIIDVESVVRLWLEGLYVI